MTRPRVGLAINPTSGRGRGRRAGQQAAAVLARAGADIVPLAAGSGPELAELTGEALHRGLEALVVVGGDGMVNLGVNVTATTGIPLGIVPAGTGNDIARGLDLPVTDPAAAAHALLRFLPGTGTAGPGPRPVDAVRCLTPDAATVWFAGVLGAGFDALVNERANAWSWPRGPIRYSLAMARELPVFRPRAYRLELDGEPWQTAAMLVAVANGPSYGGGMRVCPDARTDDGLLDVLVVKPISRLEFVRIFPRVYAGTHVRHPQAVVRQARRVRVAAEGIVGYADGERLAPLPLTCEAVPAALSLLAPRPQPRHGGSRACRDGLENGTLQAGDTAG
jgi:diacylglycerol kinase (ATP)